MRHPIPSPAGRLPGALARPTARAVRAAAVVASLIVAIAPTPAPAYRPAAAAPELPGRDGAPAPQAVLDALDRWDLPAAREALASVDQAPQGVVAMLASRIAFFSGEYAEAARQLRLLPPEIAAAEPVASYGRLVEASLALDGRLARLESEHFTLRFDPDRDWVLAEPALEALEAGRHAVGGWLGERSPSKVRVEIIPSVEEFQKVSGFARHEIETAGAVGVTAFNRIMVLSPRLLLRGYPWRDALNHEYLHFLLVGLSGNRAPIWLQEGISRYAEALWRSPRPEYLDVVDRSLLARALREGQLIPLAAMEPSLVKLPTAGAVRLAFAQCALAVDHLLAGWQVAGLRGVLGELARAQAYEGMDPVLRAAVGQSLAEFDEGWRRTLAQRGFAEVPGLAVPPVHLAGGREAEAWDLAEWQPLAAQNHVRLGDLLRGRGNARAALVEYGRARAIAPASPYVLVKVARAELDLKRAGPAAAAAREAVDLGLAYPAAHVALAEASAMLGDLEGSAAALRGALELNPFDPFAWRDLGRVLRRLDRAQEAQRAAVTALRLRQGDEAFMRSVMQDE